MTARAEDGFQSWLDAWQAWQDAAGAQFPDWAMGAHGLDASGLNGLADHYAAFADSILKFTENTNSGDLSARLAEAIEGIRDAHRIDDSDRMLRAFLAAVPTVPFVDLSTGRNTQFQQQFADTLLKWTSQWLELPTVGPHREWTEAFKRVQQAMLAQQGATQALARRYQQAVTLALGRFVVYLKDETGAPITSVKALYDAWIDIAECAYREVVMEKDFAADFAAWVNTGSDVRLNLRALFEPLAALADLPQRTEVNALLERQHELMREVESLRAELAQNAAKSTPRSESKGEAFDIASILDRSD